MAGASGNISMASTKDIVNWGYTSPGCEHLYEKLNEAYNSRRNVCNNTELGYLSYYFHSNPNKEKTLEYSSESYPHNSHNKHNQYVDSYKHDTGSHGVDYCGCLVCKEAVNSTENKTTTQINLSRRDK